MLRLLGKHLWMKMFNMRYWLSGGKSEERSSQVYQYAQGSS
jgi:hypothetical protein